MIHLSREGQQTKCLFSAKHYQSTALSTAIDTDFPHSFAVRQEILSWCFINLDPKELRKPSSVNAPTFLTRDGGNLPAMLARMQAEDSFALTGVSLDMANLVPGVLTIKVEKNPIQGEYDILAETDDEISFSTNVLSDGTLRLLALATLRNDAQFHGEARAIKSANSLPKICSRLNCNLAKLEHDTVVMKRGFLSMPYLSIKEAADDIRSGMTTPTELVGEVLERIDQLEPEIQAFVTVLRDSALKDAERAELEQRTGFFRGLLHGIPIGIKDLIAVKNVRTTAGSKVLADHVSQEDAMVVEQLRKAGAILIGKTNTHEFAYGTYTQPTRNPWDTTRIPGGSSGGSAAATVAGMCLGAIGSDTGGSIRIPAACCGITGLKPTYGRVSCFGVIPLSWSLDHVGPLGRSAEDCAILFDAIVGYDPRDPNSVTGPPSRSAALLINGAEGRSPMSLQGLKIGLPQDAFVGPLDAEVRAAWRAALLVLQEEGAELVDVELPRPTMAMYRTIQQPEATLSHQQKGWLTDKLALYTESTRAHLLQGQQISAVDYLQAQYERRIFSSAVRTVMQRVDALALPTLPIPAIRIAQIDQEINIEGVTMGTGRALLSLTMPFNLAGLPAVSCPCGFTTDGLPVGLQVVGKPFEEATVLRIAHAYQQLTDWHRRELP